MSPTTPYPNIVIRNGRFPIVPTYALPRSVVVVTAGLGNCLLLFNEREWQPIRDKLLAYPMPPDPESHAAVSALRRLLLGNARDVRVSGRGMIGLDPELAEYAHIQGRLLWVPGRKGVELWNPSNFNESNRINLFGSENT